MVGCGPSKMGSICLSGGVWLQTPVPTLGQMDQTKSQAFAIPWPGNLDTVTLPGGPKGFKLFMVDTCSFVRGSGSPFSNVMFPPQTFCEYSLHSSCCYCFVQISGRGGGISWLRNRWRLQVFSPCGIQKVRIVTYPLLLDSKLIVVPSRRRHLISTLPCFTCCQSRRCQCQGIAHWFHFVALSTVAGLTSFNL
ncbi:hypothetical protein VFPPC_11063 [Pochonia chlamydosporia 170]|uniref:Uncharacterized protein n=1 Tax=Pochonia chlamydosporia 170 TaxID=1380566 RepID=A0A179F0V9_METCM|nr:hypothetical protein VFPPC_11063 [Pochonia chlamydosporia 170]OAQ58880.1 hypothetical protein VFPPC_11063 [Pochonia chlamydosporia 170]